MIAVSRKQSNVGGSLSCDLQIDYPPSVGGWIIIVLLVGIVGVGFVVTRLVRSRGSSDLGEVSQNWLTEQRAKKQSDR